MKKLILYLFVFLTLSACSHNDEPLPQFLIQGDSTELISKKDKQELEQTHSQTDFKTLITVDYKCDPNVLLDAIGNDYKTIQVKAYASPRLIKADISGIGGKYLHTTYQAQYFEIQRKYAKGEPVAESVDQLLTLCTKANQFAHKDASALARFFGNGSLSEGMGDACNFVIDCFVPKDNFWGKLMYPFYALGNWAATKAHSTWAGLFLVIVLASSLILFILFLTIWGTKAGEDVRFLDIIRICIEKLLLAFILIYTFHILAPSQELLHALKGIYQMDPQGLEQVYCRQVFRPTSGWYALLCFAAFFAKSMMSLLSKYNQGARMGLNEDKLYNIMDKASQNIGGKLGESIIYVGIFSFIDSSLCLGLSYYFLIQLFVYTVIAFPSLFHFIRNHAGKFMIATVLLGWGLFALLTPADHTPSTTRHDNKPTQVGTPFSKAHLDSVAHVGGRLLHQLTMDIPVTKMWNYIDYKSFKKGYNGYNQEQLHTSQYMGASLLYPTTMDDQTYRFFLKNHKKAYTTVMDEIQHFSQVLGSQFAKELYENGLSTELDLKKMMTIATKLRRGGASKFDERTLSQLHTRHSELYLPLVYERNLIASNTFLIKNASAKGVQTTTSGLQLNIQKTGSGKKPNKHSTVTISYKLTKLNGEVVYDPLQPTKIQCNKVLPGITEALQHIAAGGKLTAYIPPHLAHGSKKVGNILPGEMLVCQIEMIRVH